MQALPELPTKLYDVVAAPEQSAVANWLKSREVQSTLYEDTYVLEYWVPPTVMVCVMVMSMQPEFVAKSIKSPV